MAGGVQLRVIRLTGSVDSLFTVRLFEMADAERLTQLLHAAYAELGAAGWNYTAVDQSVETTRERASGGRCWVVEHNERLVGSLTMSLPPSSELQRLTPAARKSRRAWLNQVAVDPAARGHGIATELWRRGRQWARSEGAESVGVDTAVPAEHLVRMYGSWGFTAVGTISWPGKTYDSTVMTRPLGQEDA